MPLVVVAVERTSIHEYSCLPLRSAGLSVWQQQQQHCIKPVTHVATDLVVSARSTRSHRTLSLSISIYLIPSLLLTINSNFVRFLDTYNDSTVDYNLTNRLATAKHSCASPTVLVFFVIEQFEHRNL